MDVDEGPIRSLCTDAVFEAIDDNEARIDAAYDHYAKALRSALDELEDGR